MESKNVYGSTPLSWAAEKGYEAVVKLLLDKGADVDSKDKDGRTQLFLAMANGHEAVVKLLVKLCTESWRITGSEHDDGRPSHTTGDPCLTVTDG